MGYEHDAIRYTGHGGLSNGANVSGVSAGAPPKIQMRKLRKPWGPG